MFLFVYPANKQTKTTQRMELRFEIVGLIFDLFNPKMFFFFF